MKTIRSLHGFWLLPVLAAFVTMTTFGQGIIHIHAPLSSDDPLPEEGLTHSPWDYLGTQVGPDFPIVINGQTVLNFTILPGLGGFVVQPSTTSAAIGAQVDPAFPEDVWAWPLAYGTEIGPNLAHGGWFGNNIYGGLLLTATADGHTVGEPNLTSGWFTGLESAYLGFSFQEAGSTYYGWVQVGCPAVGLTLGWVYDYAYSTIPNMPIFAGQVPEPSTWALLGMGGLTFFILRRKASRPLP